MFWSVQLSGGPRRVNHASVAVGDAIYSFGGYCTGDNYRNFSPIDVFLLNTKTLRWKALDKPKWTDADFRSWPFQRYGHTVCGHNQFIFLFGGRNDVTPCNVLYRFDTVNLKWSTPSVSGDLPLPRDGHTACVINDAMFVFGGYDESIDHLHFEVFRLDLGTFRWTAVSSSGVIPVPRDFHTATAIGDQMYVFGGRSYLSSGAQQNHKEFYSERLMIFDTKTCVWHSPIPSGPCGRRSHSAIDLDGKLLLFGGFNGVEKRHLNDMWLWDPKTSSWSELKPLGRGPEPRRRQSLCKVGDRLFLFGGTSPYDGPMLYFTEAQLALMPNNQPGEDFKADLIDHNDLFVLELQPTLRMLCLNYLVRSQLRYDLSALPRSVREELDWMSKPNHISQPLATLPSA